MVAIQPDDADFGRVFERCPCFSCWEASVDRIWSPTAVVAVTCAMQNASFWKEMKGTGRKGNLAEFLELLTHVELLVIPDGV